MLTVNNTTKSYAGRSGCMCGCIGTYNASVRARKLAITALLKNPAVQYHAWNGDQEGCIFVETAERNRVLFLTAWGVAQVKQMGVKLINT